MYKVVIVDDEPFIVEGLQKIVDWERFGCQVAGTAGDGAEGMELIRKVQPDILLSDICMPGLSGLAMIAGLKSEFDKMQITILTGFRDFDYAQRAIRLGVKRFLLKPSKMDELEEALQAMIAELKKTEAKASAEALPAEEEAAALEGEGNSFIVKNALEYMECHYNEKLKLTDVAEKTFVSQWHLSKLLNKHTGQSFSELLNRMRIEKAREMLEDPHLRIGEIAEETGFLDMPHFSRVFKKQVGISANEYRNKVLGK